MLEFGFAFDQDLTIEYATREGARVGSALANGGGELGCGPGQSPNAADGGSPDRRGRPARPDVARVRGSAAQGGMQVLIWKATMRRGSIIRLSTNTWRYVGPGERAPVVDGQPIAFTKVSENWGACSRINGSSADRTRSA